MKKLRVLHLMHQDLLPPPTIAGLSDDELVMSPWKTEFDVFVTLEDLGHEVRALGILDDIDPLRTTLLEFKPHIVFNMLEEFDGVAVYDQHIVSYLELLRQPYTGCNARGLVLARDKALSKKLLAHDGIDVPGFHVFERGRRVRRPDDLPFPLFVKSVSEEGSMGISRASIVRNDKALEKRVRYIHEKVETDAIAEQYIHGRELYVPILGNERLTTFPIWELLFRKLPPEVPRIATDKVKWDVKLQKRWGVTTKRAKLSASEERHILDVCKRAYKILDMSGFGRMDLRMDEDGRVYVLEANPNPQLGYGEDYAESAESAGVSYEELIQRILNLGLGYRAEWKA